MNARHWQIPIIFLTSLVIAGCNTTKEISIKAEPIPRPELTLPGVTQLKQRDVKWIIVTKDNVDKVFKDLESRGQNIVLFALTDDGYKALSLNQADIRELLIQQQSIIAGYKDYYVDSQKVINDANQQIK